MTEYSAESAVIARISLKLLHENDRLLGSTGDHVITSGFRQARRRVLPMIRLHGKVTADLSKPVRLNVVPYLRYLHRVIFLHMHKVDCVAQVMTLRVDAYLP